MSATPPPYTGKSKPAAKAPAAKAPAAKAPAAKAPPAPVAAPAMTPPGPQAPVYYVTIWHSRALLFGVAGLAALTVLATVVGASGFPGAAPVEQAYAIGVVVDMAAVVIALAIMIVVEYRRRADPNRLGLPVNPNPSVFAIIALVMAALTLLAWIGLGGPTQVIDLLQGLRARYMYHTGGLFFAGIPWALSLIFGAWGFRPGANRLTNIFAIVALVVGGLLAVEAGVAALVYGAGLSD